jgi:hypothetical protein
MSVLGRKVREIVWREPVFTWNFICWGNRYHLNDKGRYKPLQKQKGRMNSEF